MTRRGLLLAACAIAPAAAQQSETAVRGPVRPRQLAALGPQTDGVVRSVEVAEGDRVSAGQVLLRLADEVQAARIGLARAAAEAEGELRTAQVQLTEAAAILGRTQTAFTARAAGEWEVRQARARVDIARAAVETAEERRRVEQRRLEFEQATGDLNLMRAPFDGLVTRIDVVPGATLTRADRPVVVADLAMLEAVLYLPAAAWRRLRVGTHYPLALSAPVDRVVPARLRYLDPVMDVASSRFRAVFVIDNGDLALPAGLEAELDLAQVAP